MCAPAQALVAILGAAYLQDRVGPAWGAAIGLAAGVGVAMALRWVVFSCEGMVMLAKNSSCAVAVSGLP